MGPCSLSKAISYVHMPLGKERQYTIEMEQTGHDYEDPLDNKKNRQVLALFGELR